MRLIVAEKRKFNYVTLGLLAATIAVWMLKILQDGQIYLRF